MCVSVCMSVIPRTCSCVYVCESKESGRGTKRFMGEQSSNEISTSFEGLPLLPFV